MSQKADKETTEQIAERLQKTQSDMGEPLKVETVNAQSLFMASDQADEESLKNMESGLTQAFTHEISYYDKKLKKQVTKIVISIGGIKHLSLVMSLTGHVLDTLYSDAWVEYYNPYKEMSWKWEGLVVMRNRATGYTTFGDASKSYVDDPSNFSRRSVRSMAERNAIRKQIPETEIVALLEMGKLNIPKLVDRLGPVDPALIQQGPPEVEFNTKADRMTEMRGKVALEAQHEAFQELNRKLNPPPKPTPAVEGKTTPAVESKPAPALEAKADPPAVEDKSKPVTTIDKEAVYETGNDHINMEQYKVLKRHLDNGLLTLNGKNLNNFTKDEAIKIIKELGTE